MLQLRSRGIDFGPGMAKLRPVTFRREGSFMPQLLHLVFGGELTETQGTEFRDVDKIDIVGIFPNYATAYAAWKGKAQGSVDNAHMRYFIAHLHRLHDEIAPPPGERS